MSDSSTHNFLRSSLQHPMKQELTSCEDVKLECDGNYEKVDSEIKEETQDHIIKVEPKFEEYALNIKTEDIKTEGIKTEDIFYEAVRPDCNDFVSNGFVNKCWVCEAEFCEHVRFAENIATVKEPVHDDTAQLQLQYNETQELESTTMRSDVVLQPVVQKKKYFFCSHCDYKSGKNGNLQNHIRSKHTNEYSFKCSECYYQCNQKQQLQRHIRSKHTDTHLFICSECDYKCNLNHHLQSHIISKHSDEYLFNCSECDYKCNQKEHLQRHINSKH